MLIFRMLVRNIKNDIAHWYISGLFLWVTTCSMTCLIKLVPVKAQICRPILGYHMDLEVVFFLSFAPLFPNHQRLGGQVFQSYSAGSVLIGTPHSVSYILHLLTAFHILLITIFISTKKQFYLMNWTNVIYYYSY